MGHPWNERSSTGDERTAEELALAVQAGSSESFTPLVERYLGGLYNFLLLRTASVEDAEELTQETFLRAWQRIGRYRPQWRFSTWLFTLARRLAASHHRASRRRPAGQALREEIRSPEDAFRTASQREQDGRLWDLARRVLSPDQRSALWLRYAEGLEAPEIAGARPTGRQRARDALPGSGEAGGAP